jgi:hypothetical protein
MNKYLTTFFWTITVLLLAFSIVHFVKVLKAKKDNNTVDVTKAIVYIAGAATLAILLIYRPFDVSKLKHFKSKPMSTDTAATIITTSMSGTSGIGTTV